MDENVKAAIYRAVENEPFARALNMELIELEKGYSVVEMTYISTTMNNIYQRAHGGAMFALIDEAFETAAQTHGTIAVALNVNVTYVSSPEEGSRIRAVAREANRTKRTGNYDIRVTGPNDSLIAICQALAYRTGKPIPFLSTRKS